jgi:hypothetical protein
MEAPAASPIQAGRLPELDAVPWRRPLDDRALRLRELLSAAYTAVYCTPLVLAGLVLVAIEPLLFPVALAVWAHAWIIPELFAHRGTRVVFPLPHRGAEGPERVAQGLLGDLLGHSERDLQRATGLALERGKLGIWLVGEAGALLVRPGGRRVHSFCVRATDPALPPSDRIAHLLLALREDEVGFATVANHAFAGAAWRVRRRLRPAQRTALEAARALARTALPAHVSKRAAQILDTRP